MHNEGRPPGTADEPSIPMHAPKLGQCPTCGEAIPRGNKLIEYETADGWTAIFAECGNCTDVVHPR